MRWTQEEIAEKWRIEEEEGRRSFVRKLVAATKVWQHCEHRICRRMRRCVETQTCETRYAEDIRDIVRNWVVPYLRKRYPTVQWGAPAGDLYPQFEAAFAAEQEREAQGRKQGKPLPPKRKRKRKRVPRQPLCTPPDLAKDTGSAE